MFSQPRANKIASAPDKHLTNKRTGKYRMRRFVAVHMATCMIKCVVACYSRTHLPEKQQAVTQLVGCVTA